MSVKTRHNRNRPRRPSTQAHEIRGLPSKTGDLDSLPAFARVESGVSFGFGRDKLSWNRSHDTVVLVKDPDFHTN
jgi:hypothetical protein